MAIILIYKSLSNIVEYYKFWTDQVLETIIKVHRGHLTLIGTYAPIEGKRELTVEYYETL